MAQSTLAEEWIGKGAVLFQSQEYEKAIMAYEQALRIVPQLAEAWSKKGDALRSLDRQGKRSLHTMKRSRLILT